MKTELKVGFLIIPVEILTLTKINNKLFGFAEKAVYSYLLHWNTTSEKVFPSTRRICKALGIGSRNSITKYLHKLEEHKLIEIKRTKGKSSEYTVLSLDGKTLTKPNEKTLTSGTNQDVKRVVKESTKVPMKTPVVTQTIQQSQFEDDEDADGWIPF